MIRDLGAASKRFVEGHGIGEVALGGEEEYLGQLQVAFQAGAFWATRHRPDHDQQVADVDVILKGLGFGILTTEQSQVDAHIRYAAVEIVDALPLSDGKEEA
ncbi:hypothetical protein [Bifidobacterium crudilactis]|jgi:hypothetical protein|uniref:hypothetical protein n=1 Tax=Bifidobacterium crudilactis TaxID=327277 RepID=UPI002356ADED|nr:hypothetical protein [Bifidobacterium crudilactis]MCI1868502.1 hypothetical protein [Bifidobacterium crudilactis]